MSQVNKAPQEGENGELGTAVLLTPEGYKALHDELEYLTLYKRPEIANRIRESQEHGEFSEDNNELDEVKFEQAIVEGRIIELKTIFGTAQVLEPGSIPTDHVGIGSVVSIRDEEFGDEFKVRMVTSIEANPSKDLISADSPMGVALMGATSGQKVMVQAPDGLRGFLVQGISR